MRRHPIRGLFGGLLLGIGLALMLVQLAVVPLGEATVLAVISVCALIGLSAAWLLPARRTAATAARQSMGEPMAPAAQQPPPATPSPPADPDAPTESWRRPEDPDRES